MDNQKLINLVTFSIENHLFAVDLEAIKEVVRPKSIYPIPNSKRGVKGLINLRGTVVPVFYPYFLFNNEDYQVNIKDKKHILILNNPHELMSIIVDFVDKIDKINSVNLEDPIQIPEILKREYITKIYKQLSKQLDVEVIYILDSELFINGIIEMSLENNHNGGQHV